MTDLGLDVTQVLRAAGLPEGLFALEDARLTVREYFRLWSEFAKRVPDPAFPVRFGEAMSVEAFHPMVFAALCSRDLMVAAQRIAHYKRLILPIKMTAEERPEGFFIQKRWNALDVTVPPSLAASELVVLAQIARIGTRERIEPIRVVSLQPLEPVEEYAAFFGVRPEQGPDHGITFRMSDAKKPFVTASERLWKSFEPDLQRRLTQLDAQAPMRDRVHSVLLEHLPSGDVSIEAAARRLGLTSRTLQRRLKPEGATFKQIVRDTREKLARHYLTNTELAYAEISFLVGFEEPSSFFRAFREWTGVTPSSLRDRASA